MSTSLPLRAGRARAVVLWCAGLTLLGAAYQSAFALSGAAAVRVLGTARRYPQDDGSGGAVVAIVGGGAVALRAGLHAAGVSDRPGAANLPSEGLAPLPAGETRITALRLTPRAAILHAGECRAFFAEGRSAADGEWYSLTARPETTFELKTPDPCVVRQDGSRNIFCVPLTAGRECDGRKVTVAAVFTPADGSPVTAEATLTVRVRPNP